MKPSISKEEYQNRRKKFLAQLPADSIAILTSAPVRYKTTDNEYPYHPNNNFYYLTGFAESNCVAVFIPDRTAGQFILFNLPKIHKEEIWHGLRAGQEAAVSEFLADEAFVIDEFKTKLSTWLRDKNEIFFSPGTHIGYDEIVAEVMNHLKTKGHKLTLHSINPIIHEMRLIKSPEEIAVLRFAAQTSVVAHKRAMKICRAGLYEYHLAAELMHEFISENCQASYNNIVAAGRHGIILHYTKNDGALAAGDLLLIDAGAEYDFYDADVTTTFPVNGKFSTEQKLIYDLVLKAQRAALQLVKPGLCWLSLQQTIVQIMTEGLLKFGILHGRLDDLLANHSIAPFYMHNSGHWLGLDTHDVGLYKLGEAWRILQPGMVFTLEPGLYLSKDTPGLDPRWHDIAVRIEDDVVVTETGYELLSEGLPRTTEEIEQFMIKKITCTA